MLSLNRFANLVMTKHLRFFLWFAVIFNCSAVSGQLVADFIANKTEGCGSVEVVFTNTTMGADAGTTYSWDLGGVTSDRVDPGRIFETPGKYRVCLTATSSTGVKNTKCKDDFITVFALPEVDFSVDRTKGCSPVNVTFKNLSRSQNKLVSLTWDLGGTGNVIKTNNLDSIVTSVYSKGGKYTASLTVIDEKNCVNTLLRKDIIEVLAPEEVIPTKAFLKTCGLPWEVEIKNNNIDPDAEYTWDFGNGTTFKGANPPIVVYQNAGSFDMKVEAQKGQCKQQYIFPSFVNTEESAIIQTSNDAPCADEKVTFEDLTTLGADSLVWSIDGTIVSRSKAFDFVFSTGGCHTITLKRYRKECTDSTRMACFEVKTKPDIAYEIKNQFTCETPAELEFVAPGDFEVTWEFNNKGKKEILAGNRITHMVNAIGDYSVDLIYTDRQSCTYRIPNIPVKIEKFEVKLPSLGPGGCVGSSILLLDSISSVLPIVYQKWEVFTQSPQTFVNQRPVVMADSVGVFDVLLTVENSIGCRDTIRRNAYLRVGRAPAVNFDADPKEDCLSVDRQFTDLSSGPVNEWIWDFGDSTRSVLKDPLHNYNGFGVFDVSLIAGHNGCYASKQIKNFITVHPPKASFKLIVDCEDPRNVQINNTTALGDEFFWTLTDPSGSSFTTSDSTIGDYNFNRLGQIAISLLTKNDSTGCEHFTTDTFLLELPVAAYDLDTLFGCVPFRISIDTFPVNADSTFLYFLGKPVQNNILNIDTGGTYDSPLYIVKDKNGCLDSFQLQDKILSNVIRPAPKFNPIVCAPDDLFLTDSSTSAFGTIEQILWDVGGKMASGSSDTLFFDSKGVFDVKVSYTDSWGCVAEVDLPQSLTVVDLKPDFRADSLGCTGVSIRFIPTGNDVNTDAFFWEFGDGKTSNEQVSSNQYDSEGNFDVCLNMHDSRGCENKICKSEYVKIRDPHALFTADPVASPCPPLITNFVNQSTNAIAFEWDFGDDSGISRNENPSHVYSEPDTFSVRLIAIRSSTCADTFEIKDLIKLEGPRANISYEISGNCLPIDLTMSATSDKDYAYFWDFGNGDVDTTAGLVRFDTVMYQFTEPGIYLPKLVVQDAKGCKRIFSGEDIEVNEVDALFTVETDTICGIDSEIKLINESSTTSSVVGYEWTLKNEAFEDFSFEKDPVFITGQSGFYDAILITSSPNCRDTFELGESVEVFYLPIADFSTDPSTLCEMNSALFRDSTTLSEGSIVDLEWKVNGNIIGDSSIEYYVFDQAGRYDVGLKTITQAGCIDSIMQTVEIKDGIGIQTPNDSTICLDRSLELTATLTNPERVSAFYWALPDGTNCDACFSVITTPDVSNTYYFLANTLEGCIYKDSIVITVAQVPYPEPSLQFDDTICDGAMVEIIIANIQEDWVTGWSSDAVPQICDTCSSVEFALNGDAKVMLLVTNQFGCQSDTSVEISVEKSIDDFLIESRAACKDSYTTLKLNGPVTGLKWTSTNGKELCNSCNELEFLTETNTLIEVEVMSEEGCIYKDTVEVIAVSPEDLAMPEDTLVCAGQSFKLNATGPGIPTWRNDEQLNNTSILSPQLVAQKPTVFILNLQYDECTLTDSVFVDVIDTLTAFVNGDTVCFGDMAILEVKGDALEYWWYKNDVLLAKEESISLTGNTADVYHVVAKRTGCADLELPSKLLVHPKIEYKITKNQYLMDLNEKVQVESTSDDIDRYTYTWSPSEGLSCADCPSPHVYGPEVNTTYSVLVSDILSKCSIEDSLRVRVSDKCSDKGFYRPNILARFAQNSDNRFFSVIALDQSEFRQMDIFDRWGTKVFTTKDADIRWDGTFNGAPLSEGVYSYRVEAFCPETTEVYNFYGNVTIIN